MPEPTSATQTRERDQTKHEVQDDLAAFPSDSPAPIEVRSMPVAVAPTRGVDVRQPDRIRTVAQSARDGLADHALMMLAESVDDLERVRMATANRLRILTATGVDKDGQSRGFGRPDDDVVVIKTQEMLAALEVTEKTMVRALEAHMRRHPLGAWIKGQHGLGEKTIARLLAAIGDPYVRTDTGEPRTVSALWAYCGYHTLDGQAAKRRKGVRCNWSTSAKTRAYIVAERTTLQRKSPYRAVYDTRREHTATTHPEWTDGHSHNDAIRTVAKAILRDLWRAARKYHTGLEDDQ